MAAGIVYHDITTASGVTFSLACWVPDTGAPDVGAIPVSLPIKSDGTAFALGAGTAEIGKLAAGTANIGDVDVLTVPADPFGANADAASATGSISAKLRAIATALGVTSLDLGIGTGGSRTLRVAIDAAQTNTGDYEPVAVSQTDQVMGTGATGDYLDHVLIIPGTTSPGAVQIQDGAGTAITVFTGGTDSVSNLVPFSVPIGAISTAGAWSITTGANVTAIGFGNFT